LFCVDRRTDMAKPTVAFRNFARAPKICTAKSASQHQYLRVTDLDIKIHTLLTIVMTVSLACNSERGNYLLD